MSSDAGKITPAARKPKPVIATVPNPYAMPDAIINELEQGVIQVHHLLRRPHRYALLKTIATLNTPIWGLLGETGSDVESFEQTRPSFGMVTYPFDTGMARLPSNYPLAKPSSILATVRTACSLPDRSFYAMRIPQQGVKPDAQIKVAFFSYYGMVRFFEEQVRIFPERQTPLPFDSAGRRRIAAAWRARQNG